jgi:hypothetical protein
MKITCENGHCFERTSSCRVCPICAASAHKDYEFLLQFSAPAQRALFQHKITSLEDIQKNNLEDLSKLHGIGKSTINKIKQLLN